MSLDQGVVAVELVIGALVIAICLAVANRLKS